VVAGCVRYDGATLTAGSGGWSASCSGDCDNTTNVGTSTVYTVTFGPAFAAAPIVTVTPLPPPPFTDAVEYPSFPVLASYSTTDFTVRFATDGNGYTVSYPNSFCFQAMQ
jgi:hypothetical protein